MYRTSPLCSSTCGDENPCALVQEKACVKSSVYTDSITSPIQKVSYCPGDAVCCFPELCQRLVRNCTFAFNEYLSAIVQDIDVNRLESFARFGTDDLVEAMRAEVRPSAELSTECTKNCNGWNGEGLGDLSKIECPSQCQCKILPPAQVVPSDKYSCKHTEKGSKNVIVTYNIGDPTLHGRLRHDTRIVCQTNDECMDNKICMSNIEYQKFSEIPDNMNPIATETESLIPGLGDVTLGLLIAACAAVMVLVLVIVLIRKKKRKDNDQSAYLAM